METKLGKVSDRRSKVILGLKRKRAYRSAAFFARGPQSVLPEWPAVNSTHLLSKRRKVNGFQGKPVVCGVQCKKSLLQRYLNFSRTGVPERLMFYQNGEWTNFSEDLVALVRKDLRLKKGVIEVEFEGHRCMLDFLHMCRLDLKTGLQQPIAWIDEEGACFFPEIYGDDDELSSLCDDGQDRNGPHEIKLQLEIDINGLEQSKLKESSGESTALVKHIHIAPRPGSNHYAAEVEDSSDNKSDDKVVEAAMENQQTKPMLASKAQSSDVKFNSQFLQKHFISGMKCFDGAEILDIIQCQSTNLQDRLEIFEKQIELTGKCRGDPNVRYAWLAAPKAALHTLMTYGVGYCPSVTKFRYAIGIHLSAADHCHISASDCDVDENGTRHLVFCRVIMGNMEPLQHGSRMFHPSSEKFDNGVDDLQNPKQFIVWNMNANTHVFPEFVLSFKVSSTVKGITSATQAVHGSWPMNKSPRVDLNLPVQSPVVDLNLALASDQASESQPLSDCVTSVGNANSLGASDPGNRNYPQWIPFPLLFTAISKKIARKDMELVISGYEELRAKKISRKDFTKRLRSIVGDPLLKSALLNMNEGKMVPKPEGAGENAQ